MDKRDRGTQARPRHRATRSPALDASCSMERTSEAGARGFVALCLLSALLAAKPAHGFHTVQAMYNKTITIPCGQDIPENLIFVKWKYENPDGTPVSIAQRKDATVKFDNVTEYKHRLALSEDYSLLITNARISDEKRFVCVVVTADNLLEEPTVVKVFKRPSKPEILNKATFLQTGELTTLGECVARGSYPDGNITWHKNGEVLAPVEGTVLIDSKKELDPSSRLHTMKSTLQYMATKKAMNAQFSCSVTYYAIAGQESLVSEPATFDVHYPTDKITIETQSPANTIEEGDTVTLQCIANGNPPPHEFLFYTPGQEGGIQIPNTFTWKDVRRNATGDYRCALTDNRITSPSTTITVDYLDLTMTPSGGITKQIGDALQVTCIPSSTRNVSVEWMKNGVKLPSRPAFKSLQYQDAGKYACEAMLQAGRTRKRQTLTLTVEGKPQLKMTKKTNEDGKTKTITCHVQGCPKPAVQWLITNTGISINETEETEYVNGAFSNKIIISPEENITLTCIAENKLERTMLSLNVASISIPEVDEPQTKGNDNDERVTDQAKLIVGIVIGLLLAALAAGVAYWLYMKKSKPAAKHTGKELGNREEMKKLEENNHRSEA